MTSDIGSGSEIEARGEAATAADGPPVSITVVAVAIAVVPVVAFSRGGA
jgi:hypothetical protein